MDGFATVKLPFSRQVQDHHNCPRRKRKSLSRGGTPLWSGAGFTFIEEAVKPPQVGLYFCLHPSSHSLQEDLLLFSGCSHLCSRPILHRAPVYEIDENGAFLVEEDLGTRTLPIGQPFSAAANMVAAGSHIHPLGL